jgi:hypothetical protein
MITAYFDDSGTHTGGKRGASQVVLVAGIFGTEARMANLERNWKEHLDHPIDGLKGRLNRFHMVDCNESRGEFTGWSRTETDYFCQQLREVIIESEVAAYGCAVARRDWDELVSGDVRAFLGDAEGYCISQCFVRALRWAQDNSFDPQMTFVFDNRTPEIERRGRTIGDAFARQSEQLAPPIIAGTTFLNSTAVVPLQAADMLAWEIYQHAREILSNDGQITQPSRMSLRQLGQRMPLNTQIAQRHSIERIVTHVQNSDPELLRAAAVHFTVFDPLKPDYSHLSGESSS